MVMASLYNIILEKIRLSLMHLAGNLMVLWLVWLLKTGKKEIMISDFKLQYYEGEEIAYISNIVATPVLLQQVKQRQWQDEKLRIIWNRIHNGEKLDGWTLKAEGYLYHKGRLVVCRNS